MLDGGGFLLVPVGGLSKQALCLIVFNQDKDSTWSDRKVVSLSVFY